MRVHSLSDNADVERVGIANDWDCMQIGTELTCGQKLWKEQAARNI